MKVVLDTNIYISYLLASEPKNTISQVFEICIAKNDIDLLLPQKVIDELYASISSSKYLSKHISRRDAYSLLKDIKKASTFIESTAVEQNQVVNVRDAKDHYLLDLAITHEADYLVTGDSDLLIIKQISKLKIVNPYQFIS